MSMPPGWGALCALGVPTFFRCRSHRTRTRACVPHSWAHSGLQAPCCQERTASTCVTCACASGGTCLPACFAIHRASARASAKSVDAVPPWPQPLLMLRSSLSSSLCSGTSSSSRPGRLRSNELFSAAPSGGLLGSPGPGPLTATPPARVESTKYNTGSPLRRTRGACSLRSPSEVVAATTTTTRGTARPTSKAQRSFGMERRAAAALLLGLLLQVPCRGQGQNGPPYHLQHHTSSSRGRAENAAIKSSKRCFTGHRPRVRSLLRGGACRPQRWRQAATPARAA